MRSGRHKPHLEGAMEPHVGVRGIFRTLLEISFDRQSEQIFQMDCDRLAIRGGLPLCWLYIQERDGFHKGYASSSLSPSTARARTFECATAVKNNRNRFDSPHPDWAAPSFLGLRAVRELVQPLRLFYICPLNLVHVCG